MAIRAVELISGLLLGVVTDEFCFDKLFVCFFCFVAEELMMLTAAACDEDGIDDLKL